MRPGSRHNLLADIQRGALDSRTDLAELLRKCVALGGQASSARLREWATTELKGYDEGEVPPYRMVSCLLYLDGATIRMHVTGQQVPHGMLPDEIHDRLNEPFPIRASVAEIADIVESCRRSGNPIKLAPPRAQDLTALINHRLADAERRNSPFPLPGVGPSQVIERAYWMVGVATFAGILDKIRTVLVELTAEMQAASPDGPVPSQQVAEQALDIAVYGKVKRMVVNQVAPHGNAVAAAGGTAAFGGAEPETRSRRVMWWIVGVFTVAGAVAGGIALFVH